MKNSAHERGLHRGDRQRDRERPAPSGTYESAKLAAHSDQQRRRP